MTREEWSKSIVIACVMNDTTIQEVAEKVGVSRQMIWQVRKGIKKSYRTAAKVSAVLGIPCFDEED